MGVGLGPMLVVLVGPVLTLAIMKEKSIKRRTCTMQGGLGGGEWCEMDQTRLAGCSKREACFQRVIGVTECNDGIVSADDMLQPHRVFAAFLVQLPVYGAAAFNRMNKQQFTQGRTLFKDALCRVSRIHRGCANCDISATYACIPYFLLLRPFRLARVRPLLTYF